MKIEPFKVEEWMNAYETGARYNIAETCVDSVSLDELFELTGESKEKFWNEFSSQRLTYGYIEGYPSFKEGICSLYHTLKTDKIVPTHGAAGANHHIFYSLNITFLREHILSWSIFKSFLIFRSLKGFQIWNFASE